MKSIILTEVTPTNDNYFIAWWQGPLELNTNLRNTIYSRVEFHIRPGACPYAIILGNDFGSQNSSKCVCVKNTVEFVEVCQTE